MPSQIQFRHIVLAGLLVALTSAIITYILINQASEMRAVSPQGIQVSSCHGSTLRVMNLGSDLVNSTAKLLDTYYEDTGLTVNISGLGPNSETPFTVENATTGRPAILAPGEYYLTSELFALVKFRCA